MDENGDGVRQPGAAAMPDVPLPAGNAFVDAATDKAGRGTLDGLEPFRPALIGIDAGGRPAPHFQPAPTGGVGGATGGASRGQAVEMSVIRASVKKHNNT